MGLLNRILKIEKRFPMPRFAMKRIIVVDHVDDLQSVEFQKWREKIEGNTRRINIFRKAV